MRDAHKHLWVPPVPPRPPRQPRQSTLTPTQAVLCLLGALLATGLLFLAAMALVSLVHFLGWMFT